MFESLKHWFENLQKESKLFDHPEAELIHVALASLLYRIISADEFESAKEKQKFKLILSEEFDLTDIQISELFDRAKNLKSDLKTDLDTIQEYLKKKPSLRMSLMNKLNQLICIDGVRTNEIEIFYNTMKVIFPDIDKPII